MARDVTYEFTTTGWERLLASLEANAEVLAAIPRSASQTSPGDGLIQEI
jgi:hypothetical protein